MAVAKPGYMLEHPSIRRYSFGPKVEIPKDPNSENPIGADNQQETEATNQRLDPHRIVEDRPVRALDVPTAGHSSRRSGRPRRRDGWRGRPCLQAYVPIARSMPTRKHWSPDSTGRWCPAGILRDCTLGAAMSSGDDTVRSSWRHGEPGRNDRARYFT